MKFHDEQFRYSSNIEVFTSAGWEASVLVMLIEFLKYTVAMASGCMICMPSFMMRGCSVGISDGRDS
jgi:hypothetical protein